jgi:hypothetical protein
MVSGKQVNWSKINNKIIPASGYYLFERTSDNTVKEIAADEIFTLAGGFNNGGAKVELFKPDDTKADEVDCSAGWFAGDNLKYKTMERINPLASGNDPANWQTNQGFRLTGRSNLGGQIYGSPGRSNFGNIALNYKQEDAIRTLRQADNPYILRYYEIPAGMTLQITPGIVIKSFYADAKIDVYGSLKAEGTDGEEIIFTSGRDHSFGSSTLDATVGAWPGPDPNAQDWQGIWLHPGATGILNNTKIRYAGKSFKVGANNVSQAIRVEFARLDATGSTFTNNGQIAVYTNNSTSTISQCSFANGDRAMESDNSRVAVGDSSFYNFTNATGPLYLKNRWPTLSALEFVGNTLDMPYLENTNMDSSGGVGYKQSVYLNNLTVGASATLTFDAGVNIFVAKYGTIQINGTLLSNGTAPYPVKIQPLSAATDWGYLKFNNSTSSLVYTELRNGNLLPVQPAELNGMLQANNSNITLDNCTIWDSRPPGNNIKSINSILNINNSQIGATDKYHNAGIPGIYSAGIKSSGGQVNLNNANFTNLNIGLNGIAPLPILNLQNMSSSGFANVDYFWQPESWAVFSTST